MVLVVDATQGVEAQTVANAMMAMNANLEIIPLINKIDLPSAEPERVKAEIEDGLAIPADDAVLASGKTGVGVHDLLEAVVYNIPAPQGNADAPLRALIFDSYFDPYRGVVALVRVVDGSMHKGQKLRLMASGKVIQAEEVGARHPVEEPLPELSVGEVGYLVTGLKDLSHVKVGDTITLAEGGVDEPLPGYREAKPMVYTGLFPIDSDQYEPLKEALEKLSLNDPALIWEPESPTLGFGFRVGFLGLATHGSGEGASGARVQPGPSGHGAVGGVPRVPPRRPDDQPALAARDARPRRDRAHRGTPPQGEDPHPARLRGRRHGPFTVARRGTFVTMNYLSQHTVEMLWEIPLSEPIMDYFDKLKSNTKGYASLDYDFDGHKPSNLVKLDILLSGKPIDALQLHRAPRQSLRARARAYGEAEGHHPTSDVRSAHQAAIGGRVLARETVKAKRKDVLAKCYGGDISRKRKLLEKQKQGKKRMKAIGNVEVPQEAFMAILKVDD